LDEAVENILVNEDFADADLTNMDYEDQGENVQNAAVEEPSVLDQIRIDSVNEEIRQVWREISATTLCYSLASHVEIQRSEVETDFTELEETMYLSRNHGSLNNLNIKLGTNELPRFSCAAHKMNIAVRKAILSHKPLSKMLGKLSKFAASVKHSINLSKIHLSNKCCLRCENATRWGSSFLMLWSYIKAYNSSAFEFESCPYTLEKIELYFQILKPVYRFNLFVQKTNSTICEVLPLLSTLIHSSLERMVLNGEGILILNLFIYNWLFLYFN